MNLEIGYNLDSLMLDIGYDIKLSVPNATSNTPVYWGDVLSGTTYFYYIDDSGNRSFNSGNFYFNTSVSQNYIIYSSEKYSVSGVATGSGGLPFLNSGSSSTTLNGGGGSKYLIDVPTWSGVYYNNLIVYNTYNANIPTLRQSSPPAGGSTWSLGSTNGNVYHYTTDNSVHNSSPSTPYLPVSGQNMSYDDIRAYVVNEYNTQNPSETITIDDLPEFEEATESNVSFELDYNEILSEKEMESIIAETRYILDTTPYEIESLDYQQAISEPYGKLKEIAVLDNDTKTAMSKIYDVAERITRNDFLSLYAFSAIISIVMWFVFRR